MTNCDDVTDRMVEFARADAALPGDFTDHLEQCESCRTNWRIIQAGAAVGSSAAAAIDSDRVARTVLSRLSAARIADRRRRRYWSWGGLMTAAAALFLVVYTGRRPGGQSTVGTTGSSAAAGAFVVPVSGLDDLDASELQSVYDQLDGALSGKASVAAPHLEDLSPDEMEQVLNSLEG
jgi:anti-sigma factor RsiW